MSNFRAHTLIALVTLGLIGIMVVVWLFVDRTIVLAPEAPDMVVPPPDTGSEDPGSTTTIDAPVVVPSNPKPTTPTTPTTTRGCVVGGCSSQVCVEAGVEVITTCEWREEYSCYQQATCERQSSGQCGWTETEALLACLANSAELTQ